MKKFYRINHQIQAKELRVLDQEGKQIDVMPLSAALNLAQGQNLDLVEIAPEAVPPVGKIIDYKKFKYTEDKKEKEAKRHAKQTELKEVRFSPFIGEHDLMVGIERTKKFLAQGDIVKITIVFKGRQMAHTEFGPRLLGRIMALLPEAEKERPERFEGRRLVTFVKGTKSTKHDKTENQKGGQ